MIYDYADKVLKDLNKRNLRWFGKLKTIMQFDELNVFQTVGEVYEQSAKLAKKRYASIYISAYLAAYREVNSARAEKGEADKSETVTEPTETAVNDWLLDMLEDYDSVTHYRFNAETERKKMRLAEALLATNISSKEVDKALRYWTLQETQYAIRSVDDGRLQAFKDAGVKRVRWVTQNDYRVCSACDALNGKVFDIDKAPGSQHYNDRCYLVPVI